MREPTQGQPASDGRRALIEVAALLIARGGIPEPVARACVIADPALQDLALPVAATCQRLLREAQEPLARLDAVLAQSATNLAEFAARAAQNRTLRDDPPPTRRGAGPAAQPHTLTARQRRKTR